MEGTRRLNLTVNDGRGTCDLCGASAWVVNGVPMHDDGWRDDACDPTAAQVTLAPDPTYMIDGVTFPANNDPEGDPYALAVDRRSAEAIEVGHRVRSWFGVGAFGSGRVVPGSVWGAVAASDPGLRPGGRFYR